MVKMHFLMRLEQQGGPLKKGDGLVFSQIDKERMNKALASPRFSIPNGASKEEIRQLILGVASQSK